MSGRTFSPNSAQAWKKPPPVIIIIIIIIMIISPTITHALSKFGYAWSAGVRVCVEYGHSGMTPCFASVGEHEVRAQKAVTSAVQHVTPIGSASSDTDSI